MPESSPQSSHETISPGNVFVGRHRELGELRAAPEETRTGHGRLVMLVGEPGIGKTVPPGSWRPTLRPVAPRLPGSLGLVL